MIKILKICNKERKFKIGRKKRLNNLFNFKFYIEIFKVLGFRNICFSFERLLFLIGIFVFSKFIY